MLGGGREIPVTVIGGSSAATIHDGDDASGARDRGCRRPVARPEAQLVE